MCQKPKSNFLNDKMLVQSSKVPNLVEEHKTIFWKDETDL